MIDSIVVGFGYRARSGKDTAVAEIIKQRGLVPAWPFEMKEHSITDQEGHEHYDIRKYSFADALRKEVDDAMRRAGGAFSLLVANRPTHFMQADGNFIELPEWVTLDENPEISEQYPLGKQRPLLQFWGTEYRRSIDPSYWVRQLAQRIELEKPQIACITDMRYLNEFAFCKEHGEVVKVERLGITQGTHSSETELDSVSPEDWSIILENNATLEEFKEGAVTVFDELMTGFPFGYNKR